MDSDLEEGGPVGSGGVAIASEVDRQLYYSYSVIRAPQRATERLVPPNNDPVDLGSAKLRAPRFALLMQISAEDFMASSILRRTRRKPRRRVKAALARDCEL